ncbi:hypothetical protein F5884DRAFT_867973 [Xylogone sp. PMI_703]|nr:hypothetical protein F5884DRAFT_867973 [Xylogone sp. PMI_703]
MEDDKFDIESSTCDTPLYPERESDDLHPGERLIFGICFDKRLIFEVTLLLVTAILGIYAWDKSPRPSIENWNSFPHKEFAPVATPRPTYDPEDSLWIFEHDLDNITALQTKLDILFRDGWKHRFVLASEFQDMPDLEPFHIGGVEWLQVAAFHELHCLAYILESFGKVRLGLDPVKPIEHTVHCFNYLRQSLECLADGTLEDESIEAHGNNVMHVCNNYNALVDWIKDPIRRVPEEILEL